MTILTGEKVRATKRENTGNPQSFIILNSIRLYLTMSFMK